MTGCVRVRVPGKVNLYLAVGAREPDGYHPLATVFQAVDLYEDVTVRPSDSLTLTVEGQGAESLPVDGRNLAIKAAHALAADAGIEARAEISIVKRVPIAGGMAGGSADAAGTLLALDRLWGLATPHDDLLRIAATLGADVPFGLVGGTALGVGRGDVLTPLPASGRFSWVFVTQPTGLSTPRVFAAFDAAAGTGAVQDLPVRYEVDPATARRMTGEDGAPGEDGPSVAPEFLDAIARGDSSYMMDHARNDLARHCLDLHDGARAAMSLCHELGIPAMVSGSGPTIAALCADQEAATALRRAVAHRIPHARCFNTLGPVEGARVLDS